MCVRWKYDGEWRKKYCKRTVTKETRRVLCGEEPTERPMTKPFLQPLLPPAAASVRRSRLPRDLRGRRAGQQRCAQVAIPGPVGSSQVPTRAITNFVIAPNRSAVSAKSAGRRHTATSSTSTQVLPARASYKLQPHAQHKTTAYNKARRSSGHGLVSRCLSFSTGEQVILRSIQALQNTRSPYI